jgi:hypothetical protein
MKTKRASGPSKTMNECKCELLGKHSLHVYGITAQKHLYVGGMVYCWKDTVPLRDYAVRFSRL